MSALSESPLWNTSHIPWHWGLRDPEFQRVVHRYPKPKVTDLDRKAGFVSLEYINDPELPQGSSHTVSSDYLFWDNGNVLARRRKETTVYEDGDTTTETRIIPGKLDIAKEFYVRSTVHNGKIENFTVSVLFLRPEQAQPGGTTPADAVYYDASRLVGVLFGEQYFPDNETAGETQSALWPQIKFNYSSQTEEGKSDHKVSVDFDRLKYDVPYEVIEVGPYTVENTPGITSGGVIVLSGGQTVFNVHWDIGDYIFGFTQQGLSFRKTIEGQTQTHAEDIDRVAQLPSRNPKTGGLPLGWMEIGKIMGLRYGSSNPRQTQL